MGGDLLPTPLFQKIISVRQRREIDGMTKFKAVHYGLATLFVVLMGVALGDFNVILNWTATTYTM